MRRLQAIVKAVWSRGIGFVVALLLLVAILAIGFGVALVFGKQADYLGQALPVAVGLVAGVPLAIWLSRVEADAERGAAVERRRMVLRVIGDELREDKEHLVAVQRDPQRELHLDRLRTESWRSLSASGELRWIDDVDLLAWTSLAYHRIEIVNRIEDAWLAFETNPTAHTIRWRDATPADSLRQHLVDFDREAIEAVNRALNLVLTALGQPPEDPPLGDMIDRLTDSTLPHQ